MASSLLGNTADGPWKARRAGRERCCPATIEVQVRPSTEFSLDRAQARLRALPPPATLRHASVEDRQLYARMLNHLDNPESVRCAGALLVALKDGRAGAPLDPEDERDAIVVRSFYLWVSTPSRARVLSRTPPLIPVRSSRAGAAGVAHHAAHARERAVHVNANTLASLQIFQADVHASTTSKDSLSVFGTRRAPNWAKRCASNMKAVCIPSRCSCRYSRAGLLNTSRKGCKSVWMPLRCSWRRRMPRLSTPCRPRWAACVSCRCDRLCDLCLFVPFP